MIRIFKGCILLFLMSGQFFYFEPFWPSGLPISSSKYLSFSWAWIALWTFPHGWVQISWTYLLTDLFAGVFDKSSALYGPVCSLPSYGVKPIAPSRAPRTPDTWLLPSSSYFTISSLRFPIMTLSLVFLFFEDYFPYFYYWTFPSLNLLFPWLLPSSSYFTTSPLRFPIMTLLHSSPLRFSLTTFSLFLLLDFAHLSRPWSIGWVALSFLFVRPAMVTSIQISLLVAQHPLTHTFSESLW